MVQQVVRLIHFSSSKYLHLRKLGMTTVFREREKTVITNKIHLQFLTKQVVLFKNSLKYKRTNNVVSSYVVCWDNAIHKYQSTEKENM